MNNDTAEKLVLRLRRYSYGTNKSDKDLVTRALRFHPDVGNIGCVSLLMYHFAKDLMPKYELPLLITVIISASVACWFTRRSLKRLHFVQDMFLVPAPCTITDVLNSKCEQGADDQLPARPATKAS